MSLVIVGSVAMDSVKTPFGEVEKALGGSATYAGIASSLFASPGIVGVVGEDFPDEYISLMKNKNLDLTGLKIIEGGKTFLWKGSYEGNMGSAQTLLTDLNVFEFFKPELPENYQNSDFIFLANIDPTLQLHVLDQVKNPRMILCDTMNFWIQSKKEELINVFKRSDVVLINEGEARMLCGTPNLIKAAEEILKLGPSHVIIKKGEHGALLKSRDDYFSIPAYPLKNLKDPTGAGDTFAGAFIGYLALKNSTDKINIRKAMVAGTIMASFVCEDFSVTGTASLTIDKFRQRFNEYYEFSRIPEELL
jgi:sugar/nucleoside kinase (ribokinase family)